MTLDLRLPLLLLAFAGACGSDDDAEGTPDAPRAATPDAPPATPDARAQRAPSLRLAPTPANPVAGAPTSTVAVLGDPDDLVTTVTWTFGDGEMAVDAAPVRTGSIVTSTVAHAYAAGGLYTLAAQVGVDGASASAKLAVAPPGSACGAHNFSLTTPDFYYLFVGSDVQNPAIDVCAGEAFVFHLEDVAFFHPFCIYLPDENIAPAGVENNCKAYTDDVVWEVPAGMQGNAHYVCEIHFFGNTITVH